MAIVGGDCDTSSANNPRARSASHVIPTAFPLIDPNISEFSIGKIFTHSLIDGGAATLYDLKIPADESTRLFFRIVVDLSTLQKRQSSTRRARSQRSTYLLAALLLGHSGFSRLHAQIVVGGDVAPGAPTNPTWNVGGTLRLNANQANLFAGFSAGKVSLLAGGRTIDTQSFNVATAYGFGGAGGLTKQGGGTLTLSGASTYAGSTTVRGGMLSVTGSINSAAPLYVARESGDQASLLISSGGRVANTSRRSSAKAP